MTTEAAIDAETTETTEDYNIRKLSTEEARTTKRHEAESAENHKV
jgi:hypothetical protein